jgi:hypothetical protein
MGGDQSHGAILNATLSTKISECFNRSLNDMVTLTPIILNASARQALDIGHLHL